MKAKSGQKQAYMNLRTFDNKEDLEQDLANRMAEVMRLAIIKHGDARILLSGGSTPFCVYQKLAEMDLDWTRVYVGLVDDRMVPLDHPSSNFGVLKSVFDRAIQAGAHVFPMVQTDDWSENLELVREEYQIFAERIDYTILGMGNDGHTASLFPNDPASEADLSSDERTLLYTQAPVEPKHRMTCSLAFLAQAKNTTLMLVGEEKLNVLRQAEQQNYPIIRVMRRIQNVDVYYTN
jgi:6-phosphogluconolactonase